MSVTRFASSAAVIAEDRRTEALNSGSSVLVVDDDDSVREIVAMNLRLEGYRVFATGSGTEAIDLARMYSPDLVVLDVMMPDVDGYTVCRQLRQDPATAHTSIMMLTACAQTADKVLGLAAGADDYLVKPFHLDELLARTQTMIRRAQEMMSVSPLTGLPGNVQIERAMMRRVSEGQPVSLLYVDIDDFKAFNDRYGFLRGDEAIRGLARILCDVAGKACGAFVGHIGGDDFVIVAHPEVTDLICHTIIQRFDDSVRDLYDCEDRARGWIEVTDRRGNVIRCRPLAISIGVAESDGRQTHDHHALVAAAAEMKAFAKSQSGSAYAIDRRGQA